MIDVEYDLSIILNEELFKLYSLEDKPGSMNTLYKYIYIRCAIINNKKKLSNEELTRIALEDLNVDIFSNSLSYLEYKGKKYYLYKVADEFIENLKFRASMEGNTDIKFLMDSIFKKGYSVSVKYRGLPEYKDYIKFNRLIELNNQFGIIPKDSEGVDGFSTLPNHNPYRRSVENTLEAILKAYEFEGSQTTTYITEKQLEDYIVNNIETIEDGMKVIGRQVEIDGGIIDILARDKKGNLCILEIKINEDKSIVWQALYYPGEIKAKHNTDYVRMLTVAPKYSNHIMKSLSNIDGVEMFDYSINVINGKIDQLKVNKVN